MVRVAVVQFDPLLGDKQHNLEEIEMLVERAAARGAQLVVLPECAVNGYLFDSLDEALASAEPVPGPSSQCLASIAARHGVYCVVGMLESVGDQCFNTALLVGPPGVESTYRKTHTLCLGVDRFTTEGNIPYAVHDLPFGRVGILICYDLRFPEPARVLSLMGAQMVVLPTNWPESSTIQPDVFTRARAAENRIFVLAANRVGEERGGRFLGRSQIVAPDGGVLAEGSRRDTEVLVHDIEPDLADVKDVILKPAIHEMHCFSDRRPELYGALTARAEVPSPV